MGVRNSNGIHMTWRTIRIPDILDHKQAFFRQVFRPLSNTGPFDNQTNGHLNTRLVQYKDGACFPFSAGAVGTTTFVNVEQGMGDERKVA